jgi:hypothetical protein
MKNLSWIPEKGSVDLARSPVPLSPILGPRTKKALKELFLERCLVEKLVGGNDLRLVSIFRWSRSPSLVRGSASLSAGDSIPDSNRSVPSKRLPKALPKLRIFHGKPPFWFLRNRRRGPVDSEEFTRPKLRFLREFFLKITKFSRKDSRFGPRLPFASQRVGFSGRIEDSPWKQVFSMKNLSWIPEKGSVDLTRSPVPLSPILGPRTKKALKELFLERCLEEVLVGGNDLRLVSIFCWSRSPSLFRGRASLSTGDSIPDSNRSVPSKRHARFQRRQPVAHLRH